MTIQSLRGREARFSFERSSMAEAMLPVDVKPVLRPPSFAGRMNDRTYAMKTSILESVAIHFKPTDKQVLTRRDELLQVRVIRRQAHIELLVDAASDHSQEDLMDPATQHVYGHKSNQNLELLHVRP
jgi:1,2-phenylacetyl-CoA epoxidase PaaB subunit